MVSFSDRKHDVYEETISISRNASKANWIEQISSSTWASKGLKCDQLIACRVSVATNVFFNILQLMEVSFFLLFFLVIHRYSLNSKFCYVLAAIIMLTLPGIRVLYACVHSKTSKYMLPSEEYSIWNPQYQYPISFLHKWRVWLLKSFNIL